MFKSEKYTICVKDGIIAYKILKVIFTYKGDIFIKPLYSKSDGLISSINLKPHAQTCDICLEGDQTYQTDSILKLTFHPEDINFPSAAVHFSEKNIDSSKVRKKLNKFNKITKHIATFMFQCLQYFEHDSYQLLPNEISNKDQYLYFELFAIQRKLNYRILVFRYEKAKLKGINGNSCYVRDKIGNKDYAFIISPPDSFNYNEYILLICIRFQSPLGNQHEPCLIYYGGFDDEKTLNDLSRKTSYILAYYPRSAYNFKNKLRSIDLSHPN